jgi:hypothetical protein
VGTKHFLSNSVVMLDYTPARSAQRTGRVRASSSRSNPTSKNENKLEGLVWQGWETALPVEGRCHGGVGVYE